MESPWISQARSNGCPGVDVWRWTALVALAIHEG